VENGRFFLSTCIIWFYLLWGGEGYLWAQAPSQDTVWVRTIILSGAKKTKSQVILRELSFKEDDGLLLKDLPKILERSRQNVFNLGLFSEVRIEHFILGKELHIVIHLEERWYIFPIPKVKAEERNSYDMIKAFGNGDFHRVSYGLDLQWFNVTGRNETLVFFGQLGFFQRLRFRYSHPGIFGMQYTDLTVGASYINKNEIITGTENGEAIWNRLESEPLETANNVFLSVRHRLNLYKMLSASLEYTQRKYRDSLNIFNQSFLAGDALEAHYPVLTLAFTHDTRDFHSFPLEGRRYQLLLRLAGPEGLGTHQFAKFGFTWAEHIPLSKRFNFAYGIQNIFTLGESLPYYEKSAIGLSRSDLPGISTELRGYERYAIDGSMVSMAKAEFKFAIVPYQTLHLRKMPVKMLRQMPFGVYLSSYADMGRIEDNTLSDFDRAFKGQNLLGYGIGLNIIGFYDMMVRVEYSRNHLAEGGIYFHSSLPIR